MKVRSAKLIISLMERRIKRGWTQDENARDRNGNPVSYESPLACEFCLSGAFAASRARINWDSTSPIRFKIFEQNDKALKALYKTIAKRQRKKVDEVCLLTWNDWHGRTKEQVLELLAEVKASL